VTDPYLGEIRLLGFGFPPKGWAACDGQLLLTDEYPELFSILGTCYGGDAETTFALPDLRGRVPLHRGALVGLGDRAGEEAHMLTLPELPRHSHPVFASTQLAGQTAAVGAYWAAAPSTLRRYAALAPDVAMHPAAVSKVGGSGPHENMQPFLVLTFAIATEGVYPSRN
jgi:microcystin-dependent protein